MQKDKHLCYAVCGLICLWAAMLSGCRSAASPLAQATARAERLYDRACALINDVAYKVGDEFAPLAQQKDVPDGDEDQIQLVPAGQINPKADEAIKQAIDGLAKAMESAEGQPELDKLQAKAVLARLYALRGFRHSLEAARHGDAAWGGTLKAENAAVQMSGLGRRILTCDQILSVGEDGLDKLAQAAKTDRSAIETKIATAQRKYRSSKRKRPVYRPPARSSPSQLVSCVSTADWLARSRAWTSSSRPRRWKTRSAKTSGVSRRSKSPSRY